MLGPKLQGRFSPLTSFGRSGATVVDLGPEIFATTIGCLDGVGDDLTFLAALRGR